MEKGKEKDFYKKRILTVLVVFIGIVVVMCFLNIQVDDERYYGFYEYEDYPEDVILDGGVVTVDETTNVKKDEVIARIPSMHIDAGIYTLDTDHQNDKDFEAVVYDGDKEIVRLGFPAAETNTKQSFRLEDNAYNLNIVFLYNGEGAVTVKRSILYAKGLFYTDTLFFAILTIIAACTIAYVLIIYDVLSQGARERLWWGLLLLFVVGLNYPYYRPFWEPPVDAAFHLARIEGIYNEVIHGQYPVVLYTDALQGKGTIAALYPQLFLYIPVCFRLMHVSLEGAVRGFFIIINLATCGTSYYAAKKLTGNKYYALATMIVYCLLPYRLLSMTWRSAYGESQAFVFMPLVVLGLYEIILGDRKKWWIMTLGMTGILQSHVISTMNATIICLVAGMVFIHRIMKGRRILQVIYSVLAIVLLNLWYIIPFISYLRSDISINEQMMTQDYSEEAYYLSRFFQLFPTQGADIYTLGLGIVVLALTAIWIHITIRKRSVEETYALFLILIGIAFVCMEMKEFPWQSLQKIQTIDYITKMVKFPGRLSVICQPMLLYGSILTIKQREHLIKNKRRLIILSIALTTFQGFLITDAFLDMCAKPDISMTEMRFKPDVANQFSYDYVPSGYWEEDFTKEPETPNAIIEGYEHSYTQTEFWYTSERDTYVDLPLLYYQGYRATKMNGEMLPIEKNEFAGLRVVLPSSEEATKVSVDFVVPGSWFGLLSVSLISWIIFINIIYRSHRIDK